LPDAALFDYFRARKKKRLTESVVIIPFTGQTLREKVNKPVINKPSVEVQPTTTSYVPPKQADKKVVTVTPGQLNQLQSNHVSIKKTIEASKNLAETAAEEYTSSDKNEFSYDELKMAWKRFAFQVREDKKESFYSTLVKRDPKLVNQTEIHFELDNILQETSFSIERVELVSFLRKELKNGQISLHIEVVEDATNNVKFINNNDKFKLWAKENKHLETMRRMFNLDIDL
jgi:DNA polymerase-3 subunit gamma/tau